MKNPNKKVLVMMASPNKPDRRRAELAQIHIARKDLRLDEDTYRELLRNRFGKTSAGDLDDHERGRLLAHFRDCGWRPKAPAGRSIGRQRGKTRSPYLRKINAILADTQRPWRYAESMAARMFSVERLEWCTDQQLRKIVAALTYDQNRHKGKQA